MPLPDERPRQSVANLIGRFEQQTSKKPTPATASVPRSSSVTSQIAGDVAKEEIKEKREWPPKSVVSAEKPTVVSSPNSSMSAAPRSSPLLPLSIDTEPTPPPAREDTEPISPTPRKAPAAAKHAAQPTKPSSNSRNPTSPTNSKAPASRTSVASTARTPVKSPSKVPPKPSITSSISQPIKPQHAGGPSAVPRASAVRSPTQGRPKTAPSTPVRPKTPATHITPRPKTPSAGLFAPTAASLARARNAAPPVPTPAKKATLSSTAAERLSKPTTASKLRARSPVPTPPRVAKTASAGTVVNTAARGLSKLRVGLAPARMKEAKAKGAAKKPAAPAEVHAAETTAEQHEAEVEHLENIETEHHENGHDERKYAPAEVVISPEHADVDPQEQIDAHEEYLEVTGEAAEHVSVSSPRAVDAIPLDPEVHAAELVETDEAPEPFVPHEAVAEPTSELTQQNEQEEEVRTAVPDDNSTPQSPDVTVFDAEIERIDEVKPRQVGGDLEDIVNLLEAGAPTFSFKSRPQSIITIPDEEHVEI